MHRDGASGAGMGRSKSADAQEKSSFHVVVLGASGGPREDIVTGLLVRSTATNWARGSVIAVDGGTLLGGIIRALESSNSVKVEDSRDVKLRMTDGPFAGLGLPNVTAAANAGYIFREIISSIFITHPHLDHVAGLAMNTPLVEAQSNPKVVAALPSAIAAIKNHIFNDITWPNLSDEDGGAGLVTYQRLADGGNPRLGRGEGRGYVKACDGILTKCMSVSHGSCSQRYHPETGKHHRAESTVFMTDPTFLSSRRVSIDTQDLGRAHTPSHRAPSGSNGEGTTLATVESSAFFLRDDHSGVEIIVFGDIEPDSLSLEPRNEKVWDMAAPKIANGVLRAIFVECSFPDSVDDHYLYGHLCPRHLIAELEVLAGKVLDAMKPSSSRLASRKRKRLGSPVFDEPMSPKSAPPQPTSRSSQTSPKRRGRNSGPGSGQLAPPSTEGRRPSDIHMSPPSPLAHMECVDAMDNDDGRHDTPETRSPGESAKKNRSSSAQQPLLGLKVYIIHVKDLLADGAHPREQILEELREQERDAELGCEFFAPMSGEEVYV